MARGWQPPSPQVRSRSVKKVRARVNNSGLAKCRRKLSLCQSVTKTSLCRLMPAKTGEN